VNSLSVGQTTVAKFMGKRRPPSQGWRTFVHNHVDAIASIDLFVVPTISFGLLYGLLILGQSRRDWAGYTINMFEFEFPTRTRAKITRPDLLGREGSPFRSPALYLRAVGKKIDCAPHRRHCEGTQMDIMRRHFMRLSGIGALVMAGPGLASAINPGAFELAMGPVSAPLKTGGQTSAPGNAIVTCSPSERTCPKPHHRSKRRRAGSAVPAK
jgi:hypothetical protein